jgi:hypothetical protein
MAVENLLLFIIVSYRQEATMAGLLPERRSRNELERANDELIKRHQNHLQSWISEKAANSGTKSMRSSAQQHSEMSSQISSDRDQK